VFTGDTNATVYYLPGTTHWRPTFGVLPAVLWNPPLPYNYTTNNGTITLTGNNVSGGAVTIPGTINFLPVTSIGDWAFSSCASVTSIVIPNNVASIGAGAFYHCAGLTSVVIANGLTSIGDGAFNGCTSLASVRIPDSVTSIGSSAFYDCTSLTSVTIPSKVTNIWSWTFGSCPSLTGIYFQGNAPSFGSYAFYADISMTVYYLPGTTNWGMSFGGRPTALWQPQVQTSDGGFGVQTNQFGFNINWASGMVVVVEACTNLANPVWSSLQTNTLSGDSFYFSDPQWTNYPARLYRLRSP
jgi:hypothetical protein